MKMTLAAIVLGAIGCAWAAEEPGFCSAWPKEIERTWIGPEYWSNRLQDWRISGGRLECVTAGADHNVHLLTRQLGRQKGDLRMRVRLGRLDESAPALRNGWVGFRIGAKGLYGEYRDNAIRGEGLNLGITTAGSLFIGSIQTAKPQKLGGLRLDDMELRLTAEPSGASYLLTLSAFDPETGKLLAHASRGDIPADDLVGNLALVCHEGPARKGEAARGASVRFWFRDWRVSGSKVDVHDEQTFGPILFAQHTLSKGVLKMTAQMPPIGENDSQVVRLQIQEKGPGPWKTIGEAGIHKLARTATFRIADWDSSRDTPYRLVYDLMCPDGKPQEHYWAGTIRREPVDKKTIVVAGFTGNNDLGFPNTDVVKHVTAHNPDVLVFTGDQIYERVGGYGTQRSPLEMACLDYLRKWYILGWSFGDLMRDRPSVCMPDDHDVYHGNIWGAGGRPAKGTGQKGQDSGGYTMPAEWVNMVQRTQTSHLPDPYDPTPVEQGIGVYYCEMHYGGVSFAILEDRKFKSSPTVMIPEGNVVNGWFQNPNFDPEKGADVPGAKLLGERQLAFLRHWAADWSNGVWMKVALSQTLFANLATLPKPASTDAGVPGLRIMAPGEYPGNDQLAADADSNGWPQTGRNKALREMRRGFAFHLCGDQHLGSTIQYGADEWHDAPFALCVPAVANIWPRRWFPPEPGRNRKPGSPNYTGDFKDAFGNRMSVYAVANPVRSGREPSALYDRSTGYGIVKLERDSRTITIECWPRYADPTDPTSGGQYPGWPITIHQTDNYGRKAAAYLPTIKVGGMTDPVVQVVDETNDEIIYTLRIRGASFPPMVFKAGVYTVRIGEPGTRRMKTLTGVRPAPPDGSETIEVVFP
jgi:hypothetical protein